MKGDKSMVYFYSCDVYYNNNLLDRNFGLLTITSSITGIDDASQIIEETKELVFCNLKKKRSSLEKENINFSDLNFIFTAFNPI